MKLKEFAIINMGQSPKGETYNTVERGMPFLQGRKTFGRIYPSIDTWTTNPIKIANKSEILMSVRAPVGDMNFANQEICIGRGLCSINAKNGRNKYLYYMLLNSMNNIKQKSTGTVFDSVNRNDLENLEFNFHSEKEQDKIENILGNIDIKIELNNEINNNLYKLIKSNYESLINGCNWEEVELGAISNITSGKRPVDKSETGEYPVIGANGIMAYTSDYNFNEDLIITGRVGTLGVVKRYLGEIWASDNTLVIQTKYLNYIENYLKTIDYYSLNRGSTQPLLTQGDLKKQIIYFNEKLVTKFEKDNQIFVDKIRNNEKENSKLIQLRDSLLPKLMNGEIDLDNIEI